MRRSPPPLPTTSPSAGAYITRSPRHPRPYNFVCFSWRMQCIQSRIRRRVKTEPLGALGPRRSRRDSELPPFTCLATAISVHIDWHTQCIPSWARVRSVDKCALLANSELAWPRRYSALPIRQGKPRAWILPLPSPPQPPSPASLPWSPQVSEFSAASSVPVFLLQLAIP